MIDRFNLLRFNVVPSVKIVDFQSSVNLNVGGTTLIVKDIQIENQLSLSVKSKSEVVRGIPFTSQFSQTITGSSDLEMGVVFENNIDFSIGSKLDMGALIYILSSANLKLKGNSKLGKNMFIVEKGKNNIVAPEIQAGKTIYVDSLAGNIIGSSTDLANIVRETITIDARIGPGETLTIDSENFEIIVDGNNVIDTHNGSWVWLSRNLLDINIGMKNPGQIEGKAVFTERYL